MVRSQKQASSIAQTYCCGQTLWPQIKHPKVHRYSLYSLYKGCRHTDCYGRHLMNKHCFVFVSQREIQRNQARRHKVAQIVERKTYLTTLASWDDKASNNLYAVDMLHPTLEQPVAIEVFTLRIVWNSSQHRNLVATTLQLEGNIVALEVLGLKILSYK